MGLLIESGLVELSCFLLLIIWKSYNYLTTHYKYWATQSIPFAKPEFPYGSMKNVILTKESECHGLDKLYKQFPDKKFFGIIDFRLPALVIKDPELIKLILVKDFHHFSDRATEFVNPNGINCNLLTLKGDEWKTLRSKLTPTFTSGKLKMMFAFMERAGEELKAQLEKEFKSKDELDVKDLLARFTLEIIASCAFGIDTNCITDENTDFYRVLGNAARYDTWRYLMRVFFLLFPSMFRLLNISMANPRVRDFVTGVVRDSVEYRRTHDVTRNDFLDLMMKIKQTGGDVTESDDEVNGTSADGGLSLEHMTAQTFVFFIAGFETASSLMAFCLFELSRNQCVQEKLYRELTQNVDKNEGKISYEVLANAVFLDQVINETLRMYGSAHTLGRTCTKQYPVPGSDLVVEEGTKVIIPLYSVHHDPHHYPDPYAFKPERFDPKESQKRHAFVHMPFGQGPRNCIGMRFGMMQTRVGLATVILNYRVELSPKQKVPIEIGKKSLILMPAGPVLLKFAKRSTYTFYESDTTSPNEQIQI